MRSATLLETCKGLKAGEKDVWMLSAIEAEEQRIDAEMIEQRQENGNEDGR